jgi:hypothetical protein
MPPDWADLFPVGSARDPWLPGAFHAYLFARNEALTWQWAVDRMNEACHRRVRTLWNWMTGDHLYLLSNLTYCERVAVAEAYDAAYLHHYGATH